MLMKIIIHRYTDSELDSSFIDSKILGKLKLENISSEVVFLGPKMYCLKTIDGNFIYKIKGLKSTTDLTISDFKNLLIKDSIIEKSHTKWFRNLSESKINILDQMYSIKVTDNKRKLIYDKNNKLIGTKPYKIDINKVVK
jgi:hypothetical protein